jgi:hypothetical protein
MPTQIARDVIRCKHSHILMAGSTDIRPDQGEYARDPTATLGLGAQLLKSPCCQEYAEQLGQRPPTRVPVACPTGR